MCVLCTQYVKSPYMAKYSPSLLFSIVYRTDSVYSFKCINKTAKIRRHFCHTGAYVHWRQINSVLYNVVYMWWAVVTRKRCRRNYDRPTDRQTRRKKFKNMLVVSLLFFLPIFRADKPFWYERDRPNWQQIERDALRLLCSLVSLPLKTNIYSLNYFLWMMLIAASTHGTHIPHHSPSHTYITHLSVRMHKFVNLSCGKFRANQPNKHYNESRHNTCVCVCTVHVDILNVLENLQLYVELVKHKILDSVPLSWIVRKFEFEWKITYIQTVFNKHSKRY